MKINKTMDFEDLKSDKALAIINELNSLIKEMKSRNLKISSWYGKFDLSGSPDSFNMLNRGYGYKSLEDAADDTNFPWFKYWEVVWIITHNNFSREHRILDLGGSSSLFSYYLASRGRDVTTIDIAENLANNANFVAVKTGWNLKNLVMDMRFIDSLGGSYDHLVSLCLYEHLPTHARISVNKKVKELLVEGGKFSIIFDYASEAHIGSPEDVHEQFVIPSGLKIRGNKGFFDNGKRYLLDPYYHRRAWKLKCSEILYRRFNPLKFFKTKDANDFTFGALFLEKS